MRTQLMRARTRSTPPSTSTAAHPFLLPHLPPPAFTTAAATTSPPLHHSLPHHLYPASSSLTRTRLPLVSSSSSSPLRPLTTPATPHRQSIGRIHPVRRPPSSSSSSDPAGSVPQWLDIDPIDPTPRTHRERLLLRLRVVGRYAFVSATASLALASISTFVYYLFLDPAYRAHVYSFRFLEHHPAVLQLLGAQLVDKSDPLRGGQASAAVREQAGAVYVVVRYRVQGSQRGGVVSCEMKRVGWSWVLTYADVQPDGQPRPVLIADFRRRIYDEERSAAAAALTAAPLSAHTS